jgi:hypothetical protein
MEKQVKFNVYDMDVIAKFKTLEIGTYLFIGVAFEASVGSHVSLLDATIVNIAWTEENERKEIFDIIEEVAAKSEFLPLIAKIKERTARIVREDISELEAAKIEMMSDEEFIRDLKAKIVQMEEQQSKGV